MHDTYIKPDNSRATAIGGGPVSEDTAVPLPERAVSSPEKVTFFCPSEATGASAPRNTGSAPEKTVPLSENAALFCPSETMRLEITNLLKYCDFAGIDAENIIHEMKKEGLLPASDRKGGKKALAAFRSAVLQQIIE